MSDSSKYTEAELISSLKAGDESSFSYLYDNYSATLYGAILKIIRKESIAQDLLQEVFIKIFQNINHYDNSKGRLFTWMLRITRNTTIDKIRSKGFRDSSKIHSLEKDVNKNNSQISELPYINNIGLDNLLNTLEESHRKIIDLAYFEGYTQREIAKELAIPLGTVKTRARNALIQLRKRLNIS